MGEIIELLDWWIGGEVWKFCNGRFKIKARLYGWLAVAGQFESSVGRIIINFCLMQKKARKGVGQNKNFGRCHLGGAEGSGLGPLTVRLPGYEQSWAISGLSLGLLAAR